MRMTSGSFLNEVRIKLLIKGTVLLLRNFSQNGDTPSPKIIIIYYFAKDVFPKCDYFHSRRTVPILSFHIELRRDLIKVRRMTLIPADR